MRSACASKAGIDSRNECVYQRQKDFKNCSQSDFVTALRTDVDTIVTEYGVAEIKNCSLRDRAKKLIEISDPLHQEELIKFIN